jgi:RHS repeat-associated protein
VGGPDSEQRTVIAPDGTQTVTEKTSGATIVTTSTGAIIEETYLGDPRFGLQAPITSLSTLKNGSLSETVVARERIVEMTDYSNPLSLTKLTEQSTVNGRQSMTEYDINRRSVKTVSPQGRTVLSTWDELGRVSSMQLASLNPMLFKYDTHGRVSDVTVGERVTKFSYGDNGAIRTVTNPLGQVVTYTTDAIGRRTGVTWSDLRTLAFGYDAHNNSKTITTPSSNTHIFNYLPSDLLEIYTIPAVDKTSFVTRFGYNADQQLTSITNADASKRIFDYDVQRGRVISEALPGTEGIVTLGYDDKTGQLKTQSYSGETLTLSYDGDLVSKVECSGPIAGAVGFAYDQNRWLTSVRVGSESEITYDRDDDGLVTRVGDETIAVDPEVSAVTATTLGSINDSYSYSKYGELSGYTATRDTTTLFKQGVTRDAVGRITGLSEQIGSETHDYSFAYHGRGWLESVKRDGLIVAAYNYDANGNRLSVTQGGATINATYDTIDRITTYGSSRFSYSGSSSLSSKETSAGTSSYAYSALGALSSVTLPTGTKIDYKLDGFGRRLGKLVNGKVTRAWLYLDGLRPVAELDGAGNVVSQFVYASESTVPDYVIREGKNYRVLRDYHGSVRLVVDADTGDIVQRIDYDAFGQVTLDSNPGFQPFGFVGGLYDADTKLLRFGARDYDPEIGRWTNKDPILFDGGQSNLYVYVENDPVNYVDPSGLVVRIGRNYVGEWLQSAADTWYEIAGTNWMNGDKWAAVGPAAMGAFVEAVPLALEVLSYFDGAIIARVERHGPPPKFFEHAHGRAGRNPNRGPEWSINADGCTHDGNFTRIPKEDAEILRQKYGFDVPSDRIPRSR